MPSRIHLTGASGTGTTTLGRALGDALGVPVFDADDYFWEPTDPRFSVKRAAEARNALLAADLGRHPGWVLAGSVKGWALPEVHGVDLIVYLSLPAPLRLARLRARERSEFGAERIGPGGDMHAIHEEFMEWAARYDTAGMEQRSRVSLAAWLEEAGRPVLRIEGDTSSEERVDRVLARLRS